MIEMLERIQKLENQKKTIIGILLIVMGLASFCISQTIDGSNFKDFISGLLLGLAIGEMLIGIYVSISSLSK